MSGAGHLDFIYPQDVSDSDFKAAFDELRILHRGMMMKLDKLNERSRLCEWLRNNMDEEGAKIEGEKGCYKIPFGETYDEYFQQLTKNSKANMKKCYNRINKTGTHMELNVIHGPFSDLHSLKELLQVYTKRQGEIIHRSINFGKYLKNRYLSALTWAMEQLDSQYSFLLYLNGELAAVMTGFEMNDHGIVFPIVAMNSDWQRFSPGKVMIAESVKYLQENTDIRYIDLSRGEERYKREMGGQKHLNFTCTLTL